MNRRRFIQTSSIAAAGILTLPSFLTEAKKQSPIGLQLYTLRDVIMSDVKGVLTSVASMGYTEAETYGYKDGKLFGMPVAEFGSFMKSIGMKTVSGHYGIDMTTKHNKRHDKGYALEMVYSPSSGWNGDSESLFRECCEWQSKHYQGCPIVHAVIHHDEGTPHLHTVMVPIVGNRLPASDVKGYKGATTERNRDLFNKVAHKYGFTSSECLKGAIKRKAAQKVIDRCLRINAEDFRSTLWSPIKQAIEARPEPFMYELDILLSDVLKKGYLLPL